MLVALLAATPETSSGLDARGHIPGGNPLHELEVAVHIQDDDAYPVQFGRELPAGRTAWQSYVDQTPVTLAESLGYVGAAVARVRRPRRPVRPIRSVNRIFDADAVRCRLLGNRIGRNSESRKRAYNCNEPSLRTFGNRHHLA